MNRLPALALLAGTLAVATAPPLILLAGVPAFALAAWRLLAVALILLPLALLPLLRDLRKLSRRELCWLGASGVLYGLHFGLFNLAFSHTSKESVVVLLGAQPLLAAAIGAIWLSEPITRRMLLASAVAIAGLGVFVWHDYTFDSAHLVGDALVLLCGVAIVASYSIGRRLRPRMSLAGYLAALYWMGGLTCLGVALAMGDPLWGYGQDQWFWLTLAVLVPTLVGHSLFHYVVKYVPVFYVNLTILGEPILALLIMYGLRNEYAVFGDSTLTPLQLVGGVLLMAGVAVGIWKRKEVKP
ncbi:MAG: DMT family transporter [Planctomycetes bacterium]|nr:DMT family transporter [Planctomycetota bacterium]MCW8134985.1 DMT family transporter [Planctomycetota bacterium]